MTNVHKKKFIENESKHGKYLKNVGWKRLHIWLQRCHIIVIQDLASCFPIPNLVKTTCTKSVISASEDV